MTKVKLFSFKNRYHYLFCLPNSGKGALTDQHTGNKHSN